MFSPHTNSNTNTKTKHQNNVLRVHQNQNFHFWNQNENQNIFEGQCIQLESEVSFIRHSKHQKPKYMK